MTTQDGYDWPTPHPVAPSLPFEPAEHRWTPLYQLQPGEDWRPHPLGGIIVVHPDRAPVWIRDGVSMPMLDLSC